MHIPQDKPSSSCSYRHQFIHQFKHATNTSLIIHLSIHRISVGLFHRYVPDCKDLNVRTKHPGNCMCNPKKTRAISCHQWKKKRLGAAALKNLIRTINSVWCEVVTKGVILLISSRCSDKMVLSCYFMIKRLHEVVLELRCNVRLLLCID